MGLLKLGSIYKKKSKKEPVIDQPPTPIAPKLEPLSLELNLNSIPTIDSNTSSKPDNNNSNNSKAPAGTGSFMEDIFSQLDTKPSQNKDLLHQDFSLALALSQQLDLEDVKPSTTKSAPAKKASPAATNNDFLLGSDSIYSSYLRAMDSDNQPSSSFGTSMFDHLLTKNNTTAYHRETQPPAPAPAPAPAPPTTQVVLDSDVSDSDEASEHSEDSTSKEQSSHRMTKGVRPIMERRAQDNRLLVQRKIDNWSKQVDPDAKLVETNESMINRMKDRHRNQVKMAALRQQQMSHPHMVPQAYGMPLSQNNMVLPHPGMLMDPVHSMYYPQPEFPADYTTGMPPVPTSFMPHSTHATPSPPPPREEIEPHKPTIALSKSMSTPTIQRRTDRSAMMALPNHSSSSSSNSHHLSTDTESMVVESPVPVDEAPNLEDQLAAEEADAESSDDEERRSITLRKQKSKKQRQKSAETELSDTKANCRQVRSSRSAPNLKKNKKKKSSTASSRRNSQELSTTSTPPSETVMTPPPPPPLPNTFAQAMIEEDPNHGVPRSNSHYQMMPPHRHTLRHMKSEPELPKRNIQYQQQLNYEWERMQIHQREQQLKSQYHNKFNTSQQQPYMAMYAPVYYPTARMPYNMDSHQDYRASQMSMNNPMVYQPNYYPHHR